MSTQTPFPSEIRIQILEQYLEVSAAEMREARLTQFTTLSLQQTCSAFKLPYDVVLRATLSAGTTIADTPYDIYQNNISLSQSQRLLVRHIHFSKNFKMPFPSSITYRSLMRISKLKAQLPNLALITLDGAVSMCSPVNIARLVVPRRSRLFSMAMYAAKADGTLHVEAPAVHSAADAFSMFTWQSEVRDSILDPAAVGVMAQCSIMREGNDGINTTWLGLLIMDGVAHNLTEVARLVEVKLPYSLQIAEEHPGLIQQNNGIIYSTIGVLSTSTSLLSFNLKGKELAVRQEFSNDLRDKVQTYLQFDFDGEDDMIIQGVVVDR